MRKGLPKNKTSIRDLLRIYEIYLNILSDIDAQTAIDITVNASIKHDKNNGSYIEIVRPNHVIKIEHRQLRHLSINEAFEYFCNYIILNMYQEQNKDGCVAIYTKEELQ